MAQDTYQRQFCTSCGAELDRGERFCSSCGAPVVGVDQAQQPVADQTQIYNAPPAAPAYAAPAQQPVPVAQPRRTGMSVAMGIGAGLLVSAALVGVLFAVGVLPPKSAATSADSATSAQVATGEEGGAAAIPTKSEEKADSSSESSSQQDVSPVETASDPEPAPAVEPAHPNRYELVVQDISWTDADAACTAKGGHLATVTSQDEMNTLCAMADAAGISYVWLGGTTVALDGTITNGAWVTGEPFSYTCWYEGEPSHYDLDGTSERYIEMWKLKSTGTWSWNDERDRPFDIEEMSYMRGNMGYICEYEG